MKSFSHFSAHLSSIHFPSTHSLPPTSLPPTSLPHTLLQSLPCLVLLTRSIFVSTLAIVVVIQQDPTLLSGTLRFNIDPWGEHDDAAVWAVLDRVRLGNTVRQLGGGLQGLDVAVDEGGSNFSQGERQLICTSPYYHRLCATATCL
jgi:hypothetical protein